MRMKPRPVSKYHEQTTGMNAVTGIELKVLFGDVAIKWR